MIHVFIDSDTIHLFNSYALRDILIKTTRPQNNVPFDKCSGVSCQNTGAGKTWCYLSCTILLFSLSGRPNVFFFPPLHLECNFPALMRQPRTNGAKTMPNLGQHLSRLSFGKKLAINMPPAPPCNALFNGYGINHLLGLRGHVFNDERPPPACL